MDASSFKEKVVRIDPDDVGFDRDWSLRNKFGQVVAVDLDRGTHCIQVNMGANFRSDLYERLKNGLGWFMPSELEIQPDGWTSLMRADFIFALSVNAVFPLDIPWSPANRCMHKDHTDKNAPLAVRRAQVNVWGSVQEIDVCEAHLDQDGRCADDVPYRKPAPQAGQPTLHPEFLRLG